MGWAQAVSFWATCYYPLDVIDEQHLRRCQMSEKHTARNLHAVLATVLALCCRYFTVPFMLVLLHMRELTPAQATATLVLYVIGNMVAIYVFLFRPFTWPDGSIARFMF